MVGYLPGLDTTSTDPENPRPQATVVEQRLKKTTPARTRSGVDNCCSVCLITLLVLVVGLTFGLVFGLPHRRYSVTINSVSGLDLPPSKNLTLDPQFNLTLRVASSSPGRRVCMDVGTYVHVSYRCVPLATSAAAPRRLCVGPMKSREELVVAKGTGVQLPGFLMDSLAADLRSGVEAFNIKIGRSAGHHDAELVASCGVRRVGDTARCGRMTRALI